VSALNREIDRPHSQQSTAAVVCSAGAQKPSVLVLELRALHSPTKPNPEMLNGRWDLQGKQR
jgi:hypothetical protein